MKALEVIGIVLAAVVGLDLAIVIVGATVIAVKRIVEKEKGDKK